MITYLMIISLVSTALGFAAVGGSTDSNSGGLYADEQH